MHGVPIVGLIVATLGVGQASAQGNPGDPRRGAQLLRQCTACHSVEPGQHLSGPSLARIWGRKAGTVEGFARYSVALARADVVWEAETLDRWLKNPQAVVPGNVMTFPGVPSGRDRDDLVAYLKALSAGQAPAPSAGGMMAARPKTDLRAVGKEQRIRAIRYCGDAYHITTEGGETRPYWEFNVRFKTDGSAQGPPRGQPVVIPASMMGDRIFVVFSSPDEISATIERRCSGGTR